MPRNFGQLISTFGHWFVGLVFILGLLVGLGLPIIWVLIFIVCLWVLAVRLMPRWYFIRLEGFTRSARTLEEEREVRRLERVFKARGIKVTIRFWGGVPAIGKKSWPDFVWFDLSGKGKQTMFVIDNRFLELHKNWCPEWERMTAADPWKFWNEYLEHTLWRKLFQFFIGRKTA